jgi:hypothetical protein
MSMKKVTVAGAKYRKGRTNIDSTFDRLIPFHRLESHPMISVGVPFLYSKNI